MLSLIARSLHCTDRRVISSSPIFASSSRPGRLLPALAAAALLLCAGAHKTIAQTTYNGGGAISASGPNASASSTLTVTGASGSVKTVSVTLNNVTSNGEGTNLSVFESSFVLMGPGGQRLVLLGGTGDGVDGDDLGDSGSGLSNVTITVQDGASAAPLGTAWQHTGSATVKPSSYWLNASGPAYGTLPSDINGDSLAQTDGTATLDGTFGNTAPNGTWTLYVLTDDTFNGSSDPITISSWSLTMTFNGGSFDSTSTSVSSNTANPASTANSITYTATVTDITNPGTTVGTGTVTFTANGSAICSNVPVSGGVAHCSTTLSTQGLYSIVAGYTAGTGFESSTSSSIEQLVEHPSTETSTTTNTWCNSGSVTIPGISIGLAYPSVIKVSGYPAGTTVANVEVELEDVTGVVIAQHLLVAPDGTHNLDFFDYGFNPADTASSGINLNFYDTANNGYPDPNNAPVSANYLPSDTLPAGNSDNFSSSTAHTYDSSIPQVPGTVNYGYNTYSPGARGPITATFENNFNGAPANGTWALYPYEADADTEAIGGGWCIALTLNSGVATSTTLISNANPQVAQTPVTLTAAVTAGGNPVTSGGTVTFLENNGLPAGITSPNNVINLSTSNGQASLTTGVVSSSIDMGTSGTKTVYEGDYEMSADYSGVANEDDPSSGNLWQRFDNTTTFTAGSGNSINACNAGPVYSAQGNKGAFTPNPSNIFVANIPGTTSAVSLTLNNFYTSNADVINDVESMLEGPNKAGLDFFSGTGGSVNSALTEGNYTFSDGASSTVPSSSFSPGTYKPTSYLSNDTFTSSASGLYNTPTSFSYSQPQGSATFASTFAGISPNGTWSLFFDMNAAQNATGAANGWCLNFTENPVTVTVDESHSGSGSGGDFVKGETAAQITTTITNNGTGSTGDPIGTNPLTLTDTLASGLTYTGFSGTGWSCSAAGQTVTCTNDSSVAQSSAYSTLTLDVNVASSAPASITNSVAVSGAGISAATGSDTITVESSASLAITKSHTGQFTQGSTGVWTLVVSNTAATGGTSGTVTVSDTLPAGYTLNSYTSTSSLWTCSGASPITCTATPGIAAGDSNTITLTVNVPANSPTSVSNTASAWGGGDPVHTSAGTAAISNTDTVSVIATTTTAAANETSTFNESNQSLTLTATVTSGGGVTVTSGTVTFTVLNGGTPVGTATTSGTVSNGSVLVNYTLPAGTPTGTYTIQAVYSGSANFVGSSDNTHTLTINAASTTTTASNATTTFSAGSQIVVLSATVTSVAGAVNAGTVTFTVLNGGTPVGTATTSGIVSNGNASVNYTLPGGTPAGTYAIQAIYNASTDFTGSVESTHTLTVSGGTTITTASNATVNYSGNNQSIALNATVTSAGGTVNIGTVAFTVLQGATQIGTAVITSVSGGNASAIYTLPAGTSAGTYTILASYTGAGGFTSSTDSTHTLTIIAASTTSTASNAITTFSPGSQIVALSATVTSAAGPVNGGTVTFTVLNGGTPVGTATTSGTVSGGSASVNYTLPGGIAPGTYTIQAVYNGSIDFSGSVDSTHTLTVQAPLPAQIVISGYPSSTYVGVAHTGTVTVEDSFGDPVSTYSGSATITTSDNAATVTTPITITNGIGTITVTFATTGTQSITAAITGLNSVSETGIQVNPAPGFVVETATDDASGLPANCPAGGGGSTCTLRDALTAAASAGTGNISFSPTAFAAENTKAQNTITLGSAGTLTIPTNTTIRGVTSGSGAATTNLVTVSGGGTTTVFTVNNGATDVIVANLAITNGANTVDAGGGISNDGNLTVANCSISGNSATGLGGGILNGGTMTLIDSTVSANTAGGIYSVGGTMSIVNSTISGNTAGLAGGIYINASQVTIVDSTISGNSATGAGAPGGIYYNASLTLANSIVSGNTGGDISDVGSGLGTGYTDNGGNIIGTNNGSVVSSAPISLSPLASYGGPTQTMIPLPGSAAICAGSSSLASSAGVTADQRGMALNAGGYCLSGSVDAGAVQTDYALSFTTEPSPISPATQIVPDTNFQAAVTLDEGGSAFAGSSVSIPLTLTGAGTLSGGTASVTSGVATYSALQVSTVGSSDELIANLTLNAGLTPALAISATSSQFNVGQATPTLSFAPSPGSQTYGTAIPSSALDAAASYNSANVAGTFAYTTIVNGNVVTLAAGATVLPAGSYTITATFAPSNTITYTGASTTASYTVSPAPLTITASGGSMTYGGTVPTITASYAGFVNGDSAASLTAQPTCSTTATSHSAVGSYPSSCTGAVDANYTISYTVGSVTVANAALTVTASNANKTYGTANPTFTGTVTGAQSGDTFTESFSTTATTSSPVGTYAIVPSVSGTNLADYTQSIVNGTLNITRATSITIISLSSATITPGQNETITAAVASSTTGTPTGTVSFYDGSTLLNTATLSNGTASYSTTALAAGVSHVISANYSGDANFTTSSSTTTTSIVVAPLDFTITLPGPTSLTVMPGSSISFQFKVAPDYGTYAGTVNFAMSGLPAGFTANFSPSSIPVNGGPQTVTVTIQAPPATVMVQRPASPAQTPRSTNHQFAPFALGFLVLLGAGSLRRRSRAVRRILCVLLLLGAGITAIMIAGCGGHPGFLTQPPENYSVTLTATAANLQHSATVTLNVQ